MTKLFILQFSQAPCFFLPYRPKCFPMRLNIIFLTFRTAAIRIEIFFLALFLFPGNGTLLFYVLAVFLLVSKCMGQGGWVK